MAALDTQIARSSLASWAEENEWAGVLLRLSLAREKPDLRLAGYQLLPDVVPARTHITRHINVFYLTALFLTRLPVAPEADREFFQRFRLWLLVHALERAAFNNIQDKRLNITCSKARLAADGTERWLTLLSRIRCDGKRFDSFSLSLEANAQALIHHLLAETPDGSGAEVQFLEALIEVARHFHEPEPISTVFPGWVVAPPSYARDLWDRFSSKTDSEQASDDEAQPNVIPGQAETSGLLEGRVTKERSYVHQRLEATSILLASAQDLHWLPWSWNRLNPPEREQLSAWLKTSLAGTDLPAKAIGTYALIAALAARTTRRSLDIEFGSDAVEDWRNPCLRRTKHLPVAKSC